MKVLLYVTCFLILISCKRNGDDSTAVTEQEVREHLLNANRALVQKEAARIAQFISSRGWKMHQSESGLHFEILKDGEGKTAKLNSVVSIAFASYLLDGTLCYQADSVKPLTFVLGKGQQPRGLEEGVMQLKKGGKARLVIPSHLAFGSAGDENKIPEYSALYYEITLLNVENERP